MIELRRATADEIPEQQELWKLCFGDEDGLVQQFYEICYPVSDMFVLREDGVLRAMAVVLPMDLHLPGSPVRKSGYIYALCTHPVARNRGFIREMLAYLDFWLKDHGMDCATLVPAEASLHRFFGMQGYEAGFSLRKVELEWSGLPPVTGADSARLTGPESYVNLREAQLKGQFYLSCGEALVRYQQACGQLYGGGLYRIMVDGEEGCAAVEYVDSQRVLVKELLISDENLLRAAAALAQAVPATYYHLRTTPFHQGLPGSYLQTFGMVKWYARPDRLGEQDRQGYLGLGFD